MVQFLGMQTIAVLFGSRSAEHDVSIVTALASVIKPLELTKKYRVEAVYIAKDGSWHWSDKLKDIQLYTSGGIDAFLQKDSPVSIQFNGGMTLTKTTGLASRNQSCKIDIVFPATHGTNGEDGALMGLLDMANIPYVGCDMQSSVLAMDKGLAKQVSQAHGIMTPEFVVTTKTVVERDIAAVVSQVRALKMPLFVKPAHLGSSIGITRVSTEAELQNALEVAAYYDDKIIIEEAVENLIEVTLPIMGNKNPQLALLEKPSTEPEDFFDFDTKYMQGGKKGKSAKGVNGAQGYSELPAKLSNDLYKKAEETGLAVYAALGCSGTARIDMLIDSKTNKVYFNEINPLPGDLYAHNWRAAGVPTVQLVDTLVDLAKERFAENEKIATSFSTNYLKQF